MSQRNTRVLILTGLVVAITILTYSILLADKGLIVIFATREALLEQVGALLFLLSSVLCGLGYFRGRRQRPDSKPYSAGIFLLLAVFFFVAFGEEISWGTHLLTQRARQDLFPSNVQNELNLHNLPMFDQYSTSGERKAGLASLFTANRLFDYFMVTAFVLLPMVSMTLPRFRRWTEKHGIPILPIAFGLGLLTNLILTLIAELSVADGWFMHGAVSEIREFNYAFLCLVGVAFLISENQTWEAPTARPIRATTNSHTSHHP